MINRFKFRAWNWKDFDYIDISNWISEYESRVLQENPVTQFTWLLDKNGKEIYEGDIVWFDWNKEIYWEVVFDVFRWMWVKDWKNKDQNLYEQLWNNEISRWEIIGNKFNI